MNIATCQFNVGPSVRRNSATICGQIARAADAGADVAHFPEYGLCGYAGWDFPDWGAFDWEELREQTRSICRLAEEHNIWVILGSAHELSNGKLPHNSLYIIDPGGSILDRYDKRFCSKPELEYYTPGDHFSIFDIAGIRCSVLICADSNFPELYRELGNRGVQVVFHSFHIARCPSPNVLTQVVPGRMMGHASIHRMWISVNNSTRRIQANPSLMLRPNGSIAARLPRHKSGLMVNAISPSTPQMPDEQQCRAASGVLHSGTLVNDPRSEDRTSL